MYENRIMKSIEIVLKMGEEKGERWRGESN
jgi:hypothetical protein